MRWIGAIAAEILGLFVDDGAFALATGAWLLLAWLVLPRLDVPSSWKGLILFAGLALVLVESGVRRARSKR